MSTVLRLLRLGASSAAARGGRRRLAALLRVGRAAHGLLRRRRPDVGRAFAASHGRPLCRHCRSSAWRRQTFVNFASTPFHTPPVQCTAPRADRALTPLVACSLPLSPPVSLTSSPPLPHGLGGGHPAVGHLAQPVLRLRRCVWIVRCRRLRLPFSPARAASPAPTATCVPLAFAPVYIRVRLSDRNPRLSALVVHAASSPFHPQGARESNPVRCRTQCRPTGRQSLPPRAPCKPRGSARLTKRTAPWCWSRDHSVRLAR